MGCATLSGSGKGYCIVCRLKVTKQGSMCCPAELFFMCSTPTFDIEPLKTLESLKFSVFKGFTTRVFILVLCSSHLLCYFWAAATCFCVNPKFSISPSRFGFSAFLTGDGVRFPQSILSCISFVFSVLSLTLVIICTLRAQIKITHSAYVPAKCVISHMCSIFTACFLFRSGQLFSRFWKQLIQVIIIWF